MEDIKKSRLMFPKFFILNHLTYEAGLIIKTFLLTAMNQFFCRKNQETTALGVGLNFLMHPQ